MQKHAEEFLIQIHACTHTHTNMYKHRKAHEYKLFLSIFDLKTIFSLFKAKALKFFSSHSQFSIHQSDVSETNLWSLSLRSSSIPAAKFNDDFSSSFLLLLTQLTYTLPQPLPCQWHSLWWFLYYILADSLVSLPCSFSWPPNNKIPWQLILGCPGSLNGYCLFRVSLLLSL